MDTHRAFVSRIKLHNFKRFCGPNAEFELKPGVNYIVGDNNCGKTSFLQGVQFALSGDCAGSAVENLIASEDLAGNSFSTYVECEIQYPIKDDAEVQDISCMQPIAAYASDDPDLPNRIFRFRRYARCSTDDVDGLAQDCIDKLNALNGNYKAGGIQSKVLIWNADTCEFSIAPKTKDFNEFIQAFCLEALTQPSEVINGTTSSVTTKLTEIILGKNGFEEGDAWQEFKQACSKVKTDPNSGLSCNLDGIGKQVSELIQERFPGTVIQFSSEYEPSRMDLIKKLSVNVTENGVTGKLESKGGGLQRDVAFALARMHAETSSTGSGFYPQLLLAFDEPENCLHPKAQMALSKDCVESGRQYIIATHSPYLLTCFNPNSDSCTVLTRDASNSSIVTRQADQLGIVQPGRPSLAEITYHAFGVPTVEFHSELYGILHRMAKDEWGAAKAAGAPLKGDVSCIGDFDKQFLRDRHGLKATDRKRFDDRKYRGDKPFEDCLAETESLPVWIRNMIDHPESNKKGKDVYPDRAKELNEITDELLTESIELLLRIYEDERAK